MSEDFFELIMGIFLYGEYKRFILDQYLKDAIEERTEEWAKETVIKKAISLIINRDAG